MIVLQATGMVKDILEKNTQTVKITDKAFLKNFLSPYAKTIRYVAACVKKTEQEISQLFIISAARHSVLVRTLVELQNNLDELKNDYLPKLLKLRKKAQRKNYAVLLLIIMGHIIFYTWLFKNYGIL